MFKSYLDPQERASADKSLPRLMIEGLFMGGTGLGVLALIFEIAADAFSVAAYQTLLAIHGASGNHDIAMLAFATLSVMLFVGIVPAYKAGAYLRPNAGGSGPLVEAIGPPRLRWLSWIGTSLFFLDAILTIIISALSAADVTMLILPELAEYRILLAELFAFFIMSILVAMGPRRAAPVFLIGLFLRSMSSAMLGFSGYEMIPASGKHAARPKWKVTLRTD